MWTVPFSMPASDGGGRALTANAEGALSVHRQTQPRKESLSSLHNRMLRNDAQEGKKEERHTGRNRERLKGKLAEGGVN